MLFFSHVEVLIAPLVKIHTHYAAHIGQALGMGKIVSYTKQMKNPVSLFLTMVLSASGGLQVPACNITSIRTLNFQIKIIIITDNNH